MKRKIVGFALAIVALMSVTTSCVVREGYYGHPYHHYYRGW